MAVFFWATAYEAHDVGADHASALVFSNLRVAPAAILLCLLIVRGRRRLPRDVLPAALVSGVLMVPVMIVGASEAVARSGAGTAAVLINTYPLLVAVLAVPLLGQQVGGRAMIGLATGFAGVVVVAVASSGIGDHSASAAGVAAALAASGGWAIGTIIVARMLHFRPEIDLLALTAVQYAIGAIVLVIAVLASGNERIDVGTPALWGAAAWTSLGSSVIATLAFFAALRTIAVATASAWQFLVPVGAVVLAAFTGTPPSTTVVAGMALAIGGVLLVSTGSESRRVHAASSHL